MTYQVNEIFTSIQGEGYWSGVLATFVRLQGCTVGCPWCDTKYTWRHGGMQMNADEIVRQIDTNFVVITGGEPTLYNLDPLIYTIKSSNAFTQIQLETSGQQWLKGDLRPTWITWSPKPRLNYQAPREYKRQTDEVKFVIDDEIQYKVIRDTVNWLGSGARPLQITLMPEGTPPTEAHVAKAMGFLKQLEKLEGYYARISDRTHFRFNMR